MTNDTTLLLEVLAHWNHFIGRAFKSNLPEGMSPPMHFMITHLDEPTSMSDMAHMLRMSKQQMTKLADKAIESGLAERISDPKDRRVILLKATDKAREYTAESKASIREHFNNMFKMMEPEDETKFIHALEMMDEVFIRMEQKETKGGRKETEKDAETDNE